MPQEPLKRFQWDRCPALERIKAVQHRLSAFLREMCCLIERIQLHHEKRDPLHWGEFSLFQVDPKAQLALMICPSFECKPQEWPVVRKDRHMAERVLQVDRCRPILGTDASEDELLHEHLERKLMKGPVQDAQTQDWS